MTLEELRATPGAYDPYGYPTRSHWSCPVCQQPLTWISPPQAMVRAIHRHEASAKHRLQVKRNRDEVARQRELRLR